MQTKNILGITVSLRSLRESLSYSDYLTANIPLSTIQYITTRMLIHASKQSEIKQLLERMDMLVCGETDILKAAGINSSTRQYEIENNLYIKELCRQIHRENGSFYLLSESPDKLQILSDMLTDYLGDNNYNYSSCSLDNVRHSDGLLNHEVLANEINDFAPRIIISNLSFPYQLQLMEDLKPFLNARIWLGLPCEMKFKKRNKLLKFPRIRLKYFKKKVDEYESFQETDKTE